MNKLVEQEVERDILEIWEKIEHRVKWQKIEKRVAGLFLHAREIRSLILAGILVDEGDNYQVKARPVTHRFKGKGDEYKEATPVTELRAATMVANGSSTLSAANHPFRSNVTLKKHFPTRIEIFEKLWSLTEDQQKLLLICIEETNWEENREIGRIYVRKVYKRAECENKDIAALLTALGIPFSAPNYFLPICLRAWDNSGR